MQAQNATYAEKWKSLLWLAPAALLLFWQRQLVFRLISQVFLGILAAFAALPIARPLEKKLKRSLAAALAIFGLIGGMGLLFLLLTPSLTAQARQIAASLPGAYARVAELLHQGENWLATRA